MTEPGISVVLPTLNEAARIGERLTELEELGADEVVIVDGGSSDETESVVRHHAGRLRPRFVKGDPGRAQQMNIGAELAVGEILWFLHADVSPPQGALSAIRAALSDESVVAGCFKTWTVADDGRSAPWLHLADMRSRYSALPYGDQAVFVRRSSFEAVGGFPRQPLMEDYELARRLKAVGRIVTLNLRVRVSGRRFLAAPLRYCLMTNTFPLLYNLGVSPQRLARFYHHVR